MNLLPHKRTLCLSHLTGSLLGLGSSPTGVKCQCTPFHQCLIPGSYFNERMKQQLKCHGRYVSVPFPGLCYVNLNNVEFIFNLYKSLGEMCYSFAKRHNSCADKTDIQTKTISPQHRHRLITLSFLLSSRNCQIPLFVDHRCSKFIR